MAGLVLLTVGLVLLLNTTGALSFAIWLELVDYWPALLVLAGVEIILSQRALVLRMGVIVLTLAGVVVAAYLSMPEYDPVEPVRANYVEPLGDTRTLRLSMEFIGGSVELTSGPPSSDSLLTADFGSRPAHVIREQSGDSVGLILTSSGPFLRHSSDDGRTRHESRASFPVGLADWGLTVSPGVEVDIEISSGASDLDLDLRDIDVRRLDIEAGASDIRIQLPSNAGQTHVDIAAGVTDIELVVPRDVAASIDIAAPLGSAWVDPVRFRRTDDGYRSPHYSEAHNRVSVDIEAFAADVIVN